MGRPPFFSLTLKTFVFIKIHLLSSLLLNKASMFKWLLWIYTTEHLNLFICTLQILKFPVFPFLCIWITGWAWESSAVVIAQTQPWVLLVFFFWSLVIVWHHQNSLISPFFSAEFLVFSSGVALSSFLVVLIMQEPCFIS